MKIIRQTDTLLIVRGYGWFRFLAALLFLLSTPFWIWLASVMPMMDPVLDYKSGPEPMRRFVLVCLGAVFPLITYIWVRRTYKNWQMVLESDYAKGAVYSGMWGQRQRGNHFPLANIERAERITREVHDTDGRGNPIVSYEHSLTLISSCSRIPMQIGRGSPNDIYRMVGVINDWLVRARQRGALDSSPPQP